MVGYQPIRDQYLLIRSVSDRNRLLTVTLINIQDIARGGGIAASDREVNVSILSSGGVNTVVFEGVIWGYGVR